MPIISIATQKGGTAKTTTTVNLAAALCRKGFSILVIDSDPQANLTYSLGFSDDMEYNLYTEYKKEIMGQVSNLRKAILPLDNGLHLIPSTIDLANAELELVSKLAREQTLRKRMLAPIIKDYDYILIDCPPSFGMLTVNALVASDYIVVPLQGEFLPKKGVESFLRLVTTLKETLNLSVEVAGFLLTRYSPRKLMNLEVKDWLECNYKDKLFKTYIHTDIRLACAQKSGKDIFSYSPHSAGASDYEKLADELLEMIQKPIEIIKPLIMPEPVLN